jgi:N-methylhydantoinase A/acetone carboxylase beta subunit
MTDSFIIDDAGDYTIGKAQTTPDNEAEGVLASFDDGLGYWDTTLEERIDALQAIIYSGTATINRILEREGNDDVGVLTNRGLEDMHRFGRGIQCWIDLPYAGRLHAREHEHPEPIVPKEQIRGVGGRVDIEGDEVGALNEAEVRRGVEELLDQDLDIICVCFLFSWQNDEHEQRAKEIVEEVKAERGADAEIWLSSEQSPVSGETPRLNTLLLEAYAIEPSRAQLQNIERELQELGADASLRVLTSSGGTVSPDHEWLVDTMISGPIGGVYGGNYLADYLGIDNLVCSDVGGTSFDVALITEGHYSTRWDQSISKFLVNVPMTALDTIGSGTGSFIRVDRASDRIKIGPESAGYQVGVANTDSGLETPTVTDCTLMLGYLNPDYFLGGDIPLDLDRAESLMEDQIASPLGEDVYETARGVLDVVERDMTNELRSMIHGLGYSPENYNLISYGGGGPLHVAGYSGSLDFEDVLVPEWASAFSAFGCACEENAYRYDRQVDLQIEPDMSNADAVAARLTEVLTGLCEQAVEAFERDSTDPDRMSYRPAARMQYTGMMDDLEVEIPEDVWENGLDADDVVAMTDLFEEEFRKIFRRAAGSADAGFTITMAIGTGVVPSPKPTIPTESLGAETPPEAASKGERPIYWDGDWHDASIWEMNDLDAGNVLTGPAVAEAPATTMLVPPGYEASLDEHRIFHLGDSA